jgi:hypothetical protein
MKLDEATKHELWEAIHSRLPKGAEFMCIIRSESDGECVANIDEVEEFLMHTTASVLRAKGKTVKFIGEV